MRQETCDLNYFISLAFTYGWSHGCHPDGCHGNCLKEELWTKEEWLKKAQWREERIKAYENRCPVDRRIIVELKVMLAKYLGWKKPERSYMITDKVIISGKQIKDSQITKVFWYDAESTGKINKSYFLPHYNKGLKTYKSEEHFDHFGEFDIKGSFMYMVYPQGMEKSKNMKRFNVRIDTLVK